MYSKLLEATYKPQTHLRQIPVVPNEAAVLFIDVQNYNCHKDGAEVQALPQSPETDYWWKRVAETEPKWTQLRDTCREAGIEVMYTVIQSLTVDGRDQSLDYKISGFHVPPGSFDAEVLACIAPGADEIVLPKTSSNVFASTNIDYILRSLGKRFLILAGCLTDQCVESAVRDACDKHYYVTLVTDACATFSQERHDNSLRAINGFCRQRTVQQLADELAEAKK
ncbi:probable peroxyureidoacrylate/ureidoacrylate amidohydrolase RutB at C-terminar half [Coccomyxa sp. Obi]|nr:probable peroxyureidoacrylate/ureidoacrylate amidohydrolase RutB at C-terminar half [Coccomyxa sp. Obi]